MKRQLTIYLPEELREQLRIHSIMTAKSVTQIVVECIEKELQELPHYKISLEENDT